jgi:ABC-type amino acid transport substrate-binding protein
VSRWIARSVGVDRVRVVHGKYSELPTLLTDQRPFDLIVSGYAPAPRAGIVWSAPYLEFGLCLVVPADSLVHGVSDLHGRPIGIFDDDAAAEAVAKLVPDNRGLTRMEDDYWDALLEGRFAGFIYDYPYAVAEIRDWYASHPGREGALRIAEFNLTDSSYSVGVRAAEPELLAAVNDGIARFRASPDYRAAVHTYLSTGNRPAAVATAGRAYSIQKGDTLSGIAAKELGSPARWSEIWELNKSRFPNPDSVDVGDEILLPPT